MIYIEILIALTLSAFFSGMEIAFLSADKLRLELDRKEGGITGRLLGMLFHRPADYVTTMLVGNNIALVVYGLLMAQLLGSPLHEWLGNDALVLIAQSIISTSVILFAGEFIPKVSFKANPNQTMKMMTLPVSLFYIILYPISKLSSALTWLFFLVLGRGKMRSHTHNALSTIDLDHYLAQNIDSTDGESNLNTEVKIIQNALEFSKVQVRNCMIPRNEMIAVEIGSPSSQLEEKFTNTGLSKIVVYRDNIDDVLGYIHSSQMFKGEDWSTHIVPTVFVPESMYANKLMRQLMQQNRSIAIVIDEMGGTAGMVTLEDIVEEIFGDIEDEHDRKKLVAKQISKHSYLLSGRMEIDDINERFDLRLPEDEDYMTLAGFILNHYPHIPSQGEKVEIPPFSFEILRSSSTKIILIRLTVNPDHIA